jgi:hypothetical protein
VAPAASCASGRPGQPLADYQLTEVPGNLRGVTPHMPTIDILLENWYFVK